MNDADIQVCLRELIDKFPKWNPPEAVQRAYADLIRPYSRRVVIAAIAELWAESDKAWAEPTPAGLRKAIYQCAQNGPPKTKEQLDYETRYYAMSPHDQRCERIRSLQLTLAQDHLETRAERDSCRHRLDLEQAALKRADALQSNELSWPPLECAPEQCYLAELKLRGSWLCKRTHCPRLEN